ncbi:hypothetical protein [Comamonas sp. AG1104]|uniref:hypothetical protein n=1 Tax=Comamonas sp. AG1104 TaxID=2183900 RepID=UPI0018F1CDE3|nr:hypothetical protein [Comamonas sp. AG1104]
MPIFLRGSLRLISMNSTQKHNRCTQSMPRITVATMKSLISDKGRRRLAQAMKKPDLRVKAGLAQALLKPYQPALLIKCWQL